MSDDDPFENMDVPEDREGDPFERLGGDVPDVTPNDEGAADDETGTEQHETDSAGRAPETDDADPAFEEEFIDADGSAAVGAGGSADGAQSPGPGEPGPERAGEPSSADDDPFAGMADREGDPFGEGESAFEAVDVESVDADDVWESLQEDEPTASRGGSRYVEVSKHRFCEQCEHFAEPPAAHCTHEEAEIMEFLDMEAVRLLDCPVVAEQRRLEAEE